MVSYLPDAGIKKPSGEPGTPVSQGKEIRAGEVYGSTVRFRLPDKRRGILSGETGHGRFRRTAEAPCDGTDGCVPFVLPPDVRLRPCSLPKWSETDAKVQVQDSESPFIHVRDCRGKPTA